jgi:micrococcal nuclease
MDTDLYNYKALVKSVYDGDTITVDIDLGLNVLVMGEKLRLNRINAPELKGEEREAGLRSRDFLREKIDGKQLLIQTIKDKKEKYGRYLAEIFLTDINGNFINVNDILVQEGFAVYVEY